MKCPRDGSELSPEKYEADIEVDVCGECHGVWLDRGELEAIQETTERDYRSELANEPDPVSAALGRAREHQQPVACPKCGAQMETREYGYCSQVMVDACPEACGIWLDAGELQELEKFFEREKQKSDTVGDRALYLWLSLTSVFHRSRKR
jgi:Zn-finger nucleic acid-binding protein